MRCGALDKILSDTELDAEPDRNALVLPLPQQIVDAVHENEVERRLQIDRSNVELVPVMPAMHGIAQQIAKNRVELRYDHLRIGPNEALETASQIKDLVDAVYGGFERVWALVESGDADLDVRALGRRRTAPAGRDSAVSIGPAQPCQKLQRAEDARRLLEPAMDELKDLYLQVAADAARANADATPTRKFELAS